MTQPKKLIEVAMPIKEISAESVRDKSIRHGHISTLHLWWARRPLPVCRAVVFASLVPDPLDENCPPVFREAVEMLLREHKGIDAYKPYEDIPYTAIEDKMEDNLRNRLLMFIGKFSETYIKNGEKTAAKDKLSDASLIKWDNKNDETIIGKARKLIWVAHNADAAKRRRGDAVKSEPAADRLNSIKKSFLNNSESAHKFAGEAERSGAKRSEAKLTSTKNVDVSESFAEPNVSFPELSAAELLADFDAHYERIKRAERDLYSTPDRHLESTEVKLKESNLHNAIEAFLDKMPRVFDPFAGGGAIPLEASRLGCRSFGNDINPVAHIIQKGSLEFPQKYGKPIIYSRAEFVKRYGEEELKRVQSENSLYSSDRIKIENRLSFDVGFYARELLKRAEAEIGHFYPADEKGKKPIAYYWARVGTCSNPSCRAEVPLLKGFYLANTKTKQVYLKPIIDGNKIDFEIKKGNSDEEGWIHSRKNLRCPICGNNTSNAELKRQFLSNQISEKLLAVIEDSSNGKIYRVPTINEKDIVGTVPKSLDLITEKLPVENTKQFDLCPWGFVEYGQMFAPRQILAMLNLVQKLNEIKREAVVETGYGKAVITYLAIFLNRIATRLTSFGLFNTSAETIEHPFGRQAIAMGFDYPEPNPFSSSGGGGLSQIDWIKRYIETECKNSFSTILANASSGEKEQFAEKSMTAVITDPPYYDVIAYADLSDFFYVWLKRTLGDIYSANFATPQTPKSDECTALKYRHDGDAQKAIRHFETKLLQIFDAIEHQTSDVVSIMFAHQSTEAWTTLCNSILGARLNITGSWAIDTERSSAGTKTDKAFLSSSVTVSCKPANRSGFGDYQTVKRAIENCVEKEVGELYALGFRGADLLTACFGKAVGEFGKYEKVENLSGEEITVAKLLDMTKISAFNALLKGFVGDDFTKFYIGWLELYGFTESDFDDAAKFTRIGLSINVADLFAHDIFVKNGNKQTLAKYAERNAKKKNLGDAADASLIDKAHKAMWLYDTKTGKRETLLEFIGKVENSPDSASFWRVLTSLKELTQGTEDHKQAVGLLENKENLIRDSREKRESAEQPKLFTETI